MTLDVELVPIVRFEVKISGESIGEFKKDSSWEGMIKLVGSDGVIIVNDSSSFVDRILNGVFSSERQSLFSVVKISPDLIPFDCEGSS